jgi:hypothetical protein
MIVLPRQRPDVLLGIDEIKEGVSGLTISQICRSVWL